MAKQKDKSPEQVLDELLSSLGDLPGVIGKLGDIVGRLTSSVTPLVAALSQFATFSSVDDTVIETQKDTSEKLAAAATDRNTVAVARLNAAVDRLIAILTRTAQVALPRATPVLGGNAPATGSAAESGGVGSLGRLAQVGAVAAAAIAVLAISVNLAEREFKKLESFVRLFNPATVDLFHQALNNLGATIGRAFVPIFQVATELTRQYTSALAPIMERLVPIMQQFGQAFGNLLSGAIQTFAGLLRSMVPILIQFAQWFQLGATIFSALVSAIAPVIRGFLLLSQVVYELSGLGLVVRVLTRVFEAMNSVMEIVQEAFNILEVTITTIVDMFVTLVSSLFPVSDFMNRLTQAIQYVIRNMYVFAVMLARFAGLTEVADAIIKSVEDRLKTGDTAAQQPQIKSLEQLSRDLALASASAGAGAGQTGVKNQQEFWQKTLEEMKLARTNGTDIRTELREIKKAIMDLIPKFAIPGVPNPDAGAGGLPSGGGGPNFGGIGLGIGGIGGWIHGRILDKIGQ